MKLKKKNKGVALDLGAIAEFIIEEYRFMRTYSSAVNKLFAEEKTRYVSAYTFHESKVKELMEKFGLRAIFFDGFDYDEGLPITPLNADEFSIADHLIVEQTYDPAIITLDGNIVKQGTVSLALKPDAAIEEPLNKDNADTDTTEDKK